MTTSIPKVRSLDIVIHNPVQKFHLPLQQRTYFFHFHERRLMERFYCTHSFHLSMITRSLNL